MSRPITVAVTGLNATDNPGPGVSVIRSLLHDVDRSEFRIVGLAYDALEPGIYAQKLVDDVFLIPYPSAGREALEARLIEIHEQVLLDVVIPTLDSELPAFIEIEETLNALGIGTFLPTRTQLDLRSKTRLAALGEETGILVPKTRVLSQASDLYQIHEHIPFPLFVKGPLYGAHIAYGVDDAIAGFHDLLARWGLPLLAQARVEGDELNVVAVGDGRGGLVGAVAMRKTYLTDKGKGWAGIAIRDPNLVEMTEAFMRATQWRGPCEIEIMKSVDGTYHLLEVNPRFPAWTFLSAGAGLNLPRAVVDLARNQPVSTSGTYRAGTMFVRISIDQLADLEDFEQLTTTGQLTRHPKEV